MRLFSDQMKLMDKSYQITDGDLGTSLACEAINQAYRKIAGFSWSYLRRRTQVNTVAIQSTGTVTYSLSTNTVTLVGSTWPAWASQGILIISGQIYAVQNVLTSTTLTLMSGRAPVADVSSTTYVMAKLEYLLPADFLRMEEFITIGNPWITIEQQPGSLLQTERLFYNPSRPRWYVVRGSTYVPGRMCIEFAPPPDANYTFDLSYFAMPRQRTLQAPNVTGTVSVSGTAVIGVGTAFTQAMVGCRLRQGTSSSIPSGEFGTNGSTSENTIARVTDATHLTLVDAGVTSSGVMFLIDDPIDVERMSMDEAFCRMCEFEFALLTRDQKEWAAIENAMVRALNSARARDVRTTPRQNSAFVPTFEAMAYANLGGR